MQKTSGPVIWDKKRKLFTKLREDIPLFPPAIRWSPLMRVKQPYIKYDDIQLIRVVHSENRVNTEPNLCLGRKLRAEVSSFF